MRNRSSLLFVVLLSGLMLFAALITAEAAEWDRIVAAAKREGKIVIMGPGGALTRVALTQGFQTKYPEIQIDYSGSRGSQIPPKVLNERGARQYRVDLVVGGTTTMIAGLMRPGVLDPIHPYLAGPDIEPTAWWDGQLDFADTARKYVLVMMGYVKAPLAYNPRVVSVDGLKSYSDLSRQHCLAHCVEGYRINLRPGAAVLRQVPFGLFTRHRHMVYKGDHACLVVYRDRQNHSRICRGVCVPCPNHTATAGRSKPTNDREVGHKPGVY